MNTLPHKDGGLEMPPKLWTLRSLDIRIHMYAVHYGSFTLSYDDCLETKASLTLARIFFLQCTAIWRAKLCCFSDVKSVKTAGWRIVYAMSCHIVSSVTHKSRSSRNVWHAMSRTCTSQCSRHKSRHLGKQFWNISKFSTRHGTHYFTWPASPRIPTHTVTSSSFIGTQIACHGVNRLSCQCEACLKVNIIITITCCIVLCTKMYTQTDEWWFTFRANFVCFVSFSTKK